MFPGQYLHRCSRCGHTIGQSAVPRSWQRVVSRTATGTSPFGSRAYAKAVDDPERHDPALLKLLHSYPLHNGATPYEILGFKSSQDFRASFLKKRFHELAKIYHPDSSTFDGCALKKKTFFTTNSSEEHSADGTLSAKVKAARFKQILAAYTLLKNPRTRTNYDDYSVGWHDNSGAMHRSPNPNYHNPESAFYRRQGQSSAGYGHASSGTWEDHWNSYERTYDFRGDENWEDGGETFKENLYRNRKNVAISIALFAAVYGALQATHVYLYDDYMGALPDGQQTYSLEEVQSKCEQDLFDARSNFGMGLTKDDRINRFLWFRQISMLLNMGDLGEIIEKLKKERLTQKSANGEVHMKKYDAAVLNAYERSETSLTGRDLPGA